jgi:hypothetical protein
MWVSSFFRDDSGEQFITGKKFMMMETTWKDDFVCYSRFHCYILSHILSHLSEENYDVPRSAMVGKGSCLILDNICREISDFSKPGIGKRWSFALEAHCL